MSEFAQNRPQRLCLKCGKCCKIVANKPVDELKKLSNEKCVQEFLQIFEPYSSKEEAISVDAKLVSELLKSNDNENITFYKCKYLKNNLCSIYENRPDFCKEYPSTPFTNVPSDCGFVGWLFQEREKLKAKIRRQKEIIISLETKLKMTQDKNLQQELSKEITEIKTSLDKYKDFGVEDW